MVVNAKYPCYTPLHFNFADTNRAMIIVSSFNTYIHKIIIFLGSDLLNKYEQNRE